MPNKSTNRLLSEKWKYLSISAMFAILFLILVYFITSCYQNTIDQCAFLICQQFTSPVMTRIARIATFFGTGNFLVPSYALIIRFLVKKNQKRFAALVTTIAVSGLLLGWLLKDLFHRARPPYHLVNGAGGYSFPSGHALGGFIFTALVLAVIRKTNWHIYYKRLFSALTILLGLFIGISRIYLHVHFATDVLGGFLVAVIWFCLLHFIFRYIYGGESGKAKMVYPEQPDYLSGNYHLN